MKKLRLGASLVAFLVALLPAATPVAAASCRGTSHESTLEAGTVTPPTIMVGETVTFSVTYADTAACAPSKVVVNVDGVGKFPLSGSGTRYASGVTYSASLILPAGTRTYSFTATSGSGRGTTSVTLTAVAPTSVIVTPAATATPTPVPATTPVSVTPSPKPPAPPAVVAPVPPPPAPTVAAVASPLSPPGSAASPSAVASDSAAPAAVPPAAGPLHDSWVGAPARPATDAGPAHPPQAVGSFLAERLPLTAGAFVTATAGGLGLFFLFLRRRRPEPEPQLAAVSESVAGTAVATVDDAIAPATSAEEPMKLNLRPIRELVPPPDPFLLEDPEERIGPSPEEAGIPRWLRPSVRSARMGPVELRQRNWKA